MLAYSTDDRDRDSSVWGHHLFGRSSSFWSSKISLKVHVETRFVDKHAVGGIVLVWISLPFINSLDSYLNNSWGDFSRPKAYELFSRLSCNGWPDVGECWIYWWTELEIRHTVRCVLPTRQPMHCCRKSPSKIGCAILTFDYYLCANSVWGY